MEKRLNKKVESYITTFKDSIRDKVTELNVGKMDEINKLMQFIYDYDRLTFGKEDFVKRKRVKNVVPFFERCCAKRANDEQCTRRKKEGCEYCGTHVKGSPHGIFETTTNASASTFQKVEVWAQEIYGIIYYIDKNGNVYEAEDIVMNKNDPKIIAKYTRIGDEFSIPDFNSHK